MTSGGPFHPKLSVILYYVFSESSEVSFCKRGETNFRPSLYDFPSDAGIVWLLVRVCAVLHKLR